MNETFDLQWSGRDDRTASWTSVKQSAGSGSSSEQHTMEESRDNEVQV